MTKPFIQILLFILPAAASGQMQQGLAYAFKKEKHGTAENKHAGINTNLIHSP